MANRFVGAITSVYSALKMAFTGWGNTDHWPSNYSGYSDYSYKAEPNGNSIVVACILWMCRTWPDAPFRVVEDQEEGESPKEVQRHPLTKLMFKPNPHYSGILMWWATLADWILDGNAYWIKVRARDGTVVQLWWVPSHMMEPAWPDDGSEFISHYEYTVDNRTLIVRVDDVVHFRHGLDPNNMRKGLSPLGSVIREIFADDEAGRFSAAILNNLGMPGIILSPELASGVPVTKISPEAAEQVKAEFNSKFGGSRRGEPLVLGSPVKVTALSHSPADMDWKGMRRLPEERVSAVLGEPAVVVGLGAGLDRSTFTNFSEAREAAYEGNIIPVQRLFAAEIDIQLLPDFEPDRDDIHANFDISQVRILQTDMEQLIRRTTLAYKAGIIKLNEARVDIGKPKDPNGEVYILQSSFTPIPADGPYEIVPPEPTPAPTDGTGNTPADNQPQDETVPVTPAKPTTNGRVHAGFERA